MQPAAQQLLCTIMTQGTVQARSAGGFAAATGGVPGSDDIILDPPLHKLVSFEVTHDIDSRCHSSCTPWPLFIPPANAAHAKVCCQAGQRRRLGVHHDMHISVVPQSAADAGAQFLCPQSQTPSGHILLMVEDATSLLCRLCALTMSASLAADDCTLFMRQYQDERQPQQKQLIHRLLG